MSFIINALILAGLLILFYLIAKWISPKKSPSRPSSLDNYECHELRGVVSTRYPPSPKSSNHLPCLVWDDAVPSLPSAQHATARFNKSGWIQLELTEFTNATCHLLDSGLYRFRNDCLQTRIGFIPIDYIHQNSKLNIYRIERGSRPPIWLKFQHDYIADDFDRRLGEQKITLPRQMNDPKQRKNAFWTVPANSLAKILGSSTLKLYKRSNFLLGKESGSYCINMGSHLFKDPNGNDEVILERILLRIASEIRAEFEGNLVALKEVIELDGQYKLDDTQLAQKDVVLHFGKLVIERRGIEDAKQFLKRSKSELAFELLEGWQKRSELEISSS